MIKINVEVDEASLRKLVKAELERRMGIALEDYEINIEVKSKQNYKSEWEPAAFRATVNAVRQPGED